MTAVPPREFTVWAPNAARSVKLVLDGEEHPMAATGGGWWRVEAPDPVGARYGYSLDDGPVWPGPRCPRLPDGPHGLAAIYDSAQFEWTDADWPGRPLEGAVLYELHIGTFTPQGTFDAAIEHLDHLVALGIDVVEVMPVASFPGRHGWGYDGVSPWAAHEPYGGPAGLQRFVDACHARGLGVCLDVVYNHLGPDGTSLNAFGPYFTDRHRTPWGPALNLDGPDSDPVRDFLIGNALHWLRDFHLDGLRLDAVHELHDDRAVHILEELAERVRELAGEVGRPLWLVAESDRNDPRTVLPPERGGLGLDGQWADDVHHALHVALTGERQGYYADFAAPGAMASVLSSPFFHADTWSSFRGRRHGRPVPAGLEGWRFVVSLENHDQVGNRAVGDRHAGSLGVARLECGAALLLTSPYTPMLFMGEEWAASTPWQYFTNHVSASLGELVRQGRRREFSRHGWNADDIPDPQDPATRERSVLRWDEVGLGDHARVLEWYRRLIALRRERADLREGDLGAVRAHAEASGLVVVERGAHRVVVNLGTEIADADLRLRADASVAVLLANADVTLQAGRLRLGPDTAAVVGPVTRTPPTRADDPVPRGLRDRESGA